MAVCCDPGSGFPSASDMKDKSQNTALIFAEICAIQQAILAAASPCQPGGGQYCTSVAGTSPMTSLQNITSVTITNGGAGYMNMAPIAQAYRPDNTNGGAIFNVVTNGGTILSIDVVDGGTGYQPITAVATVNTMTGTGAQILLVTKFTTGTILQAYITAPGSGYQSTDTITVTHPKGTGAILIPTFDTTGGLIGIRIENGGIRYNEILPYIKIMSSTDPTKVFPYGAGLITEIATDASTGAITSVIVNDGGTGYIDAPPIAIITDVSGSGATIELKQTAGTITSAIITNGGYGYSQSPTIVAENPVTSPHPTTYAQFTMTVQLNKYGVDSAYYWQVASGTVTNAVVQDQIDQVISYFTQLGYSIDATVNPDNGYTLMWTICWGQA